MLKKFLHPFKALKPYLPKTMFGRTLVILISPLILVQTISAYVFFDRHWEYVTKVLANNIAGDVASITNLYKMHPDDGVLYLMMAKSHMGFDTVFKPGEYEIKKVSDDWSDTHLDNALSKQFGNADYGFEVTDHRIIITIPVDDGVLEFTTNRKRLYSKTTPLFVMWAAGTTVVFLIISAIFLRNQIKPLRRLAIAAEKFGKGRNVPIKPEGSSEIRLLTESFVDMRRRLQRQITQRTDMLAGVSHDIRTPLTRMKLQLSMMPETPETKGLLDDISDMEQMVDGYLAFARGEEGEKPKRIDLKKLVEDICRVNNNNQDKTIRFFSNGIIPSITLRENAIRRSVTNLVNNAQRYANNAWVNVNQKDGYAFITIEDDGPGIPEDRQEEVFKPFFRMEESRNQSTGGVGLGMTISRDIIRNHGGDISLERSPEHKGLKATIRLPL